jgi:hypothetical protein
MYEYTTRETKGNSIASECNKMAADGWELTEAVGRQGHHQGETEAYILIFRRPKNR